MASTCDSKYVKVLDPVARLRYHLKLSYNKGASSLPDPHNLKGWTNPSSWPDLTFGDLYTYLIETPGIYTKESLKAFKSLEAYQFVISGHVKPLCCRSVGDNIPYCFIKGKVIPSQRINDQPHNAWVCLHKKDASLHAAHCTLHMYGRVRKMLPLFWLLSLLRILFIWKWHQLRNF